MLSECLQLVLEETPFCIHSIQFRGTYFCVLGVEGTVERRRALRDMEKAGLNVVEVCKEAVENSRRRYLSETGMESSSSESVLHPEDIPSQPLSSYTLHEV